MAQRTQGPYQPTYLPYWLYLGGGAAVVGAGGAITITPGAGVTIVELDAEDAALYVNLINPAAVNAPIFIAENGARIIGPLDVATFPPISVLGSGAGVVHYSYWRQVIDRGP